MDGQKEGGVTHDVEQEEAATHKEHVADEASLAQADELKKKGNTQFAAGAYSDAVTTYTRALASCPTASEYETAVLQANISACHIKTSEWDEAVAAADKSLDVLDQMEASPNVDRLKSKALLRRAKARTEINTWSSLQGALEDYKLLEPLSPAEATPRIRELQPRLDAAKQAEMAEMMTKLKGLGNTILKPFGLSTDNFQLNKDEKTGGYSMNMRQ